MENISYKAHLKVTQLLTGHHLEIDNSEIDSEAERNIRYYLGNMLEFSQDYL